MAGPTFVGRTLLPLWSLQQDLGNLVWHFKPLSRQRRCSYTQTPSLLPWVPPLHLKELRIKVGPAEDLLVTAVRQTYAYSMFVA